MYDYHRWYQQSRSHLCPPNTYHTRQDNQKDPGSPKDHPKDTLAPYNGQTPPLCGARHIFFFVNGSTFLHTKSRRIYFRSAQACNNRGEYESILVLKNVKEKYKDIGFTITDYHVENEFEHLRDFFAPSHLHTCAANEQIMDIERSICATKGKVRCGCHSIHYKKFTKLMMIYLVQYMITCLNMFPSKNGISRNLTPAAIILVSPNPDYNKPKITFRTYAQVYIGTANSKKQRTVGTIVLIL